MIVMRRALLMPIIVVCSVSCSEADGGFGEIIDVDDYDRSCSENVECLLVPVGDVCNECIVDAISYDGRDEHRADISDIACDQTRCALIGDDGVLRRAVCDGEQCVREGPP